MKKFELCHPIDPTTVLVPDLLEVQEPEIDKCLGYRRLGEILTSGQ